MSYQPMDPVILDQMYEHPERFGHLSKDEYIQILIDDIRYWRALAERPMQKTSLGHMVQDHSTRMAVTCYCTDGTHR